MAKITHIDIIKGFSVNWGAAIRKNTSPQTNAATTFTWQKESTPYT